MPGTILVVEDDPAVRRLAVLSLRRHGHTVFEAENGPAALALWDREKRGIDVVLTDMIMPGGMSGLEVALALRRDRPDLPVIVSSGYAQEMADPEEMARLNIGYLPKPYEIHGLCEAVSQAIRGEPLSEGTAPRSPGSPAGTG